MNGNTLDYEDLVIDDASDAAIMMARTYSIIMKMNLPQPSFEWRDREGGYHPVSGMETKYIFNVLLMIWNHAVPEKMRIDFRNAYTFGPFYNVEYMVKAFCAMMQELDRRKDLTDRQEKAVKKIKAQIEAMRNTTIE